jgi:hypothetical protein
VCVRREDGKREKWETKTRNQNAKPKRETKTRNQNAKPKHCVPLSPFAPFPFSFVAHQLHLAREEFIKIVTWIDANVPYYGTHELWSFTDKCGVIQRSSQLPYGNAALLAPFIGMPNLVKEPSQYANYAALPCD